MENRRRFLEAGAGILILRPDVVFGSKANSTPEFGVIGCGSRGTWIAQHFIEFTGSRITAAADVFEEPLALFSEKYNVARQQRFTGLDGYKELVKTRIDGVIIESPPYFHPEQALAAVEAGKPVFCAKPVATDVPGAKLFLAASKSAAGKQLSFLVDFQTRNRPVFEEAVSRVHRGDIGTPVLGHIYYHGGRNRAPGTTGLSPEMAEIKGWLHSRRLSGDIIVEQNIHVIDVANWYLQGHPLKAVGTCGQAARRVGDVSDHYIVMYFYDKGAKVDFSSVQFAQGYSDLCMRLYGAAGVCDAHYNGVVRITGDHPWEGSGKDDTFRGGAIQNVKDFVNAVRGGTVLNNGEEAVRSNLTAVLGRVAALRGRPVTWDEMMEISDRYTGDNCA